MYILYKTKQKSNKKLKKKYFTKLLNLYIYLKNKNKNIDKTYIRLKIILTYFFYYLECSTN